MRRAAIVGMLLLATSLVALDHGRLIPQRGNGAVKRPVVVEIERPRDVFERKQIPLDDAPPLVEELILPFPDVDGDEGEIDYVPPPPPPAEEPRTNAKGRPSDAYQLLKHEKLR